jgi:DNA-binding transcriptional MerR regulator
MFRFTGIFRAIWNKIWQENMKTARKYIDFGYTGLARSSMKIGEVSQASGIGIEALRFYERSGLLGKPMRSQSGYRLYDEGILERLAFIKKAQTLGFSLEEIKKIIRDAQSGASPCDDVREIVRRRLKEVEERIKEMQRFRKELTQTLEEWDEVGRAPGHVCGLIEGTEIENSRSKTPKISPKIKRKISG